jgi:hypothetical protein
VYLGNTSWVRYRPRDPAQFSQRKARRAISTGLGDGWVTHIVRAKHSTISDI